MVEQRQLEIALPIRLRQAEARSLSVHFPLVLMMDDHVAESDQLHRRHALVGAIIEVLHLRGHLLGKRLLDPLAFDCAGQPQQGPILRSAPSHLADGRRHKERRTLHDALAH